MTSGESVEEVQISRLNLVVGKIIDVKKHPDADELYVESIDVGEDTPRTILSGISKYKTPEQVNGQFVVVVKNLKPRNLRGIMSNGMILCATTKDMSKLAFLCPPEKSEPGDKVFFEGMEGVPNPVLNPKKKIFEKLAVDFNIKDDLVVRWKSIPFSTKNGVVKVVPGFAGSIVS